MIRLGLVGIALGLAATPVAAQIVGPPHVFSPNTVISSTEVNANFAAIYAAALNRAAGTMTGRLLFSPDNTHDIGSPANRPRDFYLGRNATIGGLLTLTGGIAGSGAGLTGIPETAITDGTLLARVGDNETISGTYTFTSGAGLRLANNAAQYWMVSNGAPVNARKWRFDANFGGVGSMALLTIDDAEGTAGLAFSMSRTATAVTAIAFGAPTSVSGATTPLSVNRTGSDGALVNFDRDSGTVGSVSVAGGVVAYNTFLGAHYTQLEAGQVAPAAGTVVVSTGRVIPLKPRTLTRQATDGGERDDGSGRFVYVAPSARRNQKGVYGVWHAALGQTAAAMAWGDPEAAVYQVAGVGLGPGVWVTDTCGPIANGDWLATSPIAGLAERQCGAGGTYDNVARDYTLGKALTDVDWSRVPRDADGVRKVRIPVIITAG
jgi:hypothetical protein